MTLRKRIGFRLIAIVLAAGMLSVACTPEEEQAISDALNSAAQDLAMQAIDFALEFGRQALAAFLL